MTGEAPSGRGSELEARLGAVRERIALACAAAGRDPAEITLVAVTKFFPATDIDLLVELGVRAIAENRDQEASAKIAQVRRRGELVVHFIGQLQSNKARSVVTYCDVVQSVDRPKLVAALDHAAQTAGARPVVLVQVRLEEAQGRGGVPPVRAQALADLVAASPHLELRGVMAVAPLGADPVQAFARLREVAHGIREAHPEATWVSAGMSDDLEAAIGAGATHLRVGSAILGSRQSLR
jgi:PLP dependent protein